MFTPHPILLAERPSSRDGCGVVGRQSITGTWVRRLAKSSNQLLAGCLVLRLADALKLVTAGLGQLVIVG